MADPDKVPDSQEDTQATYDPTADSVADDTQHMASSMLSESQDFKLVDEEAEKSTQNDTQMNQSTDNTQNMNTEPAAKADMVDASEAQAAVSSTDRETDLILKSDDVACGEAEKKKDEVASKNDNDDDDDDDFVQSSQQVTVSPLKKQISSLTSAISQKRKAESSELSPAKFPRTCSQEDALSSVRKKSDEDEDLFDEGSPDNSATEDFTSNIIIQETPETCENEPCDDESKSLQEVEKELEEALSQHDDCNENAKPIVDDDTKPSSPSKDKSTIKDDKCSSTQALEDKVTSSTAETTETKKSDGEKMDEEISSLTEIIEAKKSSDVDATKETKSTTPQIAKADEATSQTKVNEDAKSATNMDVAIEESNIIDNTKTVVDAPSQNRQEPTECDPTAEDSDSKKDSTDKIKDAEIKIPKDSEPRKIEETDGVVSKMSEIPEKTEQTETIPPIPITLNKSRMSIEVIYDKSKAPPEKKRPRELVEIDEDGEKIVLDSSQETCDKSIGKTIPHPENETSYKTSDNKTSTDYKTPDTSKESVDSKSSHSLTNGSAETKKSDSEKITTIGSDASFDSTTKKMDVSSPSKKLRHVPEVLISISDSEGDSFVVDDRGKNKLETLNRDNTNIKTMEKELSILVKLKCLIHVDETTKEHVEKIITSVTSESTMNDLSTTRPRNSDLSACMADISGNGGENRDASPGSVTSNVQPYPLNHRLSLASTLSSSSGSSAASMNSRIASKTQFQLPRGPAKHAKKMAVECATMNDGKSDSNECYENINREWKNVGLLLNSFFNCAREELAASEIHNGSTERVDNSLERIRSSTPEVETKEKLPTEISTPKSTNKRSRSTKRSRSKTVGTSGSNGLTKSSPVVESEIDVAVASSSSSRKRKSTPETTSRQSTNSKDSLNETTDEIVGKEVFAKWSDNKYYPGTVIGKTKTKFKVNFYDGQNKLIIEDFIVPMPDILHVGLSVYATSVDDDYGSCGIIIDAKRVKDDVVYTVQTDEQDELRVGINNIFLTNDQVQVLREETKIDLKTPPSTPKHLGKVSLDNVVEGKRRSKRVTTPVVTTPKSKRARGSLLDKTASLSKPSASGIASSAKNEEIYDTTSDSNYSVMEESDMLGVMPELIGTPNEQETKGPANRIKGKARGRKRSEDPEIVAKLGPIPSANSNIFNGMSFLLTCASLDIIDRFQTDTKDSNSDPGTENEEEWTRKPFVRERLVAQLNAGGGKLYESFEAIPPEEYPITKLITNVPNLTKKSLLCLSVGIKAYNHQWIIRCCQENKIVNPSEEELPAGWSLMKQTYVEMFQRRNKKPFQTLPVIVVIPLIPGEKDFVTFWTYICQNAGGAVLLPEGPDDVFIEGTVVLTNKRCPSWAIEKAKSWSIPLVSTTWVIQSLIEGNICTYDAHPSFDYNYTKRSTSHISNLKRLQ